jgi:hypothetical protein
LGGENQYGIEFAAPLVVAFALGVRALGEEILFAHLKLGRAQLLHVGFKQIAIRGALGKAREGLHGLMLARSPLLVIRYTLPQRGGGVRIGGGDEERINDGGAASAQQFVVIVGADRVRMTENREGRFGVIYEEFDQEVQLRPDVLLLVGEIGGKEGGVKIKANVVHAKTGDGNQAQLRGVELARRGGAYQKVERVYGVMLAGDAAVAGTVNRSLVILAHD